ncbi:hypothetical protein F4778DRAFT_7380 [Xylariomycetidae sp. FL2044]|nr:hypothetical protein F4778DRAFT_7380 [Xylariomycetidae sp. FL2044]
MIIIQRLTDARVVKIGSDIASIPTTIDQSTARVVHELSLLQENRAHASEMAVGHRIDGLHADLVARATRQEHLMEQLTMHVQALAMQDKNSNRGMLGRKLSMMMLSKPSLLRDVQEELVSITDSDEPSIMSGQETNIKQSPHNLALGVREKTPPRLCQCWRQRSSQRTVSWWPTFSFVQESNTEMYHQPGCSYGYIGPKHQRRISFTFTGLQSFISTAVSVGLTLTHGAGGHSISPTFQVYAMVDEWWCTPHGCRPMGKHIDTRNITVDSDDRTQKICLRGVHKLLQGLVNIQIPCETSATLAGRAVSDSTTGTLYPLLLPRVENINSETRVSSFNLTSFSSVPEHVLEAFGLDSPLFQSLLRRDEAGLRQALQNMSAARARAQNNRRITPVHCAVQWPTGLRMILDNIKSLGVDINAKTAWHGESALYTALVHSYRECSAPDQTLCSDCPCAEAVAMLLQAGCFLGGLELGAVFGTFLVQASLRARVAVLEHIKEFRQALRLQLSPEASSEVFGSDSLAVPDVKLPTLVERLKKEGIDPGDELDLQPHDYRLCCLHGSEDLRPMYHMISDRHIAEIAFNLGFRDVDAECGGLTPISQVAKPLSLWVDFNYIEWLLNHGACYENVIPQFSDYEQTKLPRWTSAHVVLKHIGIQRSLTPQTHGIVRQLGMLTCTDGCRCGCSPPTGGCMPFISFLNAWWLGMGQYCWECQDIPLACCIMMRQVLMTKVPLLLAEAIIRAMTFNALELRHTCCVVLRYCMNIREAIDKYKENQEDFEEIQEEDKETLLTLEELVADFVVEYHTQGEDLLAFIEGPWLFRMREVQDEMSRRTLTEVERKRIFNAGVLLDDSSAEYDSCDEYGSSAEDSDAPGDPEFWIRELDSIC